MLKKYFIPNFKSCALQYNRWRRLVKKVFLCNKEKSTGKNCAIRGTMWFSCFLNGDKATIRKRMQSRPGHFMPAKLLDSQFDALERPSCESDVHSIDIDPPLDKVTEKALAIVRDIFQLAQKVAVFLSPAINRA